MRLKLFHKFLAAFLLTSCFVMVLFIGIMQYYIYRNFEEYVNKAELGKLDDFTAAIGDAYRENDGWADFRGNPRRWADLIRSNLLKNHPIPKDPPHFGDPPHMDDFMGRPPHPFPGEPHRPPPERDRTLGSRPVDPLQIGRRLSLFDAELKHVAGSSRSSGENTLRPVPVNGKTVGWLGLKNEKGVYHPMDAAYLTAQTRAFYLIGFGILTVIAVISFFLSKHLLAPVRQLTQGTKALASFNFDTKIEVSTHDELGQLAEDFNQMAHTLKKYETMRRQWITDISHELRTPLAILRGEIEAVRDGIRDLNMGTLDSLYAEVIQLGNLVENLHRLSLSDSGNLYIQKEPVRPLAILGKTIATFQGRLDRQRIALHYDSAPADHVTMPGDPGHLIRLFSNLLENTIRYTDSPGRLEISAELKEHALTIRFDDTPPGVPEEALDRIFERLFRVDKSRSRALGGSGLGLSICQQIVESHGGSIRAVHGKLGGLSVIVDFPLTPDKKRTK